MFGLSDRDGNLYDWKGYKSSFNAKIRSFLTVILSPQIESIADDAGDRVKVVNFAENVLF